jgi:hypothetical protein
MKLLKVNKDGKDAKYWALKKEVDDMKIKFVALQRNKESFQRQGQVEEMTILKLKEGLYSIVH